jgi:hypothetical protein
MRAIARFFFMHLGTLVAIVTYFQVFERGGYSEAALQRALVVGLVVSTAYMALARSQGHLKQFDLGFWIMFAVGTLASFAGIGSVVWLFQNYSPAIVFVTLALTALIPLLLGRETFTYYYSRRQLPAWQMKTPEFHAVSRVVTAYWILLFAVAAALCVWSPRDPRFTLVYPNLLVLGAGLTATLWLPPLYFRLFPAGLPASIEPLVMGMPFVFDRKAAGDVRAAIQFVVSGKEPGSYYLQIADGKCSSLEGTAPRADLTLYTPDSVWMRIARGELDGGKALAEGLYRAEGDLSLLVRMTDLFPTRR